jgi:UPF0288 family protein (methanogenesis marker protein 3)
MYAEPTPDSEHIGTVFAGDELMAVAEQGDWLQVNECGPASVCMYVCMYVCK